MSRVSDQVAADRILDQVQNSPSQKQPPNAGIWLPGTADGNTDEVQNSPSRRRSPNAGLWLPETTDESTDEETGIRVYYLPQILRKVEDAGRDALAKIKGKTQDTWHSVLGFYTTSTTALEDKNADKVKVTETFYEYMILILEVIAATTGK